MSDKEIHQNSSQKCPQKNHRGCYGDYCCIPGRQSAFYDANRVKICIALFKLPRDSALRKKSLQVIKRYKRTGGDDKFSKFSKFSETKRSWFVNFILTQSKFGCLWEQAERYIYQEVYRWCLNLNLQRRKNKENLPSHVTIKKRLVNPSETGTEPNSVVNLPKDLGNKSKPLAENEV